MSLHTLKIVFIAFTRAVGLDVYLGTLLQYTGSIDVLWACTPILLLHE